VTLIDSNVLIDLLVDDPNWFDWSLRQLEHAALRGPLLINDIVYAEISTNYSAIEDFESALAVADVTVLPIPRMALFLAGKAFTQYRRAGGIRAGVLPDFFIGAHAAVKRLPLLTRDARRYRRYFPTVALITPEGEL
jgi:hypothetical protein